MAKRKQKGARKWKEIGERLERTRAAFDLGQGEFAERAGLKQNTYNQYETGSKRASLDNAIALCKAYDLTLDWIYLGEPSGLPYGLAHKLAVLKKS